MKKDMQLLLCDKQIAIWPNRYVFDFIVALAQILTIFCVIKERSALRGGLYLIFFGGTVMLADKYEKSKEKRYLKVGAVLGIMGIIMFVCVGVNG